MQVDRLFEEGKYGVVRLQSESARDAAAQPVATRIQLELAEPHAHREPRLECIAPFVANAEFGGDTLERHRAGREQPQQPALGGRRDEEGPIHRREQPVRAEQQHELTAPHRLEQGRHPHRGSSSGASAGAPRPRTITSRWRRGPPDACCARAL